MKIFEVFIPCEYSECYVIEARTAEEAIKLVKDTRVNCIGEEVTGREDEGVRAVEVIHKKGPQRKKVQHE